MIREAGDRIEVSGAMTLASAKALLESGSSLLTRNDTVFDLSDVSEVDSSGLTVVFGWVRAASRQGKQVRISNPPQNLLSLAALYGVTELLPLA
ncbi:MAG: anti-sigma-factor [Rhodocyclaceae bacterium]|jgi:phospholipid transport system transporter-binding protein|nr:anti-sigma-factor [Rhodocyclaceae bacterium]